MIDAFGVSRNVGVDAILTARPVIRHVSNGLILTAGSDLRQRTEGSAGVSRGATLLDRGQASDWLSLAGPHVALPFPHVSQEL